MNIEVINRVLEVDDIVVHRAVGSGERIVEARALRYGVPYTVSDNGGRSFYDEAWRAGVFAKSLAQRAGLGRIPLKWHHQHQDKPYGAVIGVNDSTAEFIFRAKVVNGERGDEMLELIEMGAVPGVSVGARPLVNRAIRGGIERIEAALLEISLTASAMIGDGEILAVRAVMDDGSLLTLDDAREIENLETPQLDEALAFLASLKVGAE